MIKFLLCAVSMLLPSILGFALWELMQRPGHRSHWESFVFAFPLGMGAVATLMLLYANLGFPLERASLFIPIFSACLILLAFLRYQERKLADFRSSTPVPSSPISRRTRLWWIFLGFIGIQAFIVAAPLVKNPQLIDWDSWAIWGLKAKAIFVDGGFDGYLSHAAEYGFSWPARPCFSSIFQAFIFIICGQVNEAAVRIMHLACYASVLLIFYAALRRALTAEISMIWTAMLATVPNLTFHATAGVANLPLALFIFAAIIALNRWCFEGAGRYLPAATAFIGFALLTRDEALGLCIISFLAFLFFGLRGRWICRNRILLQSVPLVAGSAAIYWLWARIENAYPAFDLRSVWITTDIFRRAIDHMHDLGTVSASILAQLTKPSEQMVASPLESILGISLFWPLFLLTLIVSLIRFVPSSRFFPHKRAMALSTKKDPSSSPDGLAASCGLIVWLGLGAYAFGLYLFPYSDLNDLSSWSHVLDRHVISLVPAAACHMALAISWKNNRSVGQAAGSL